MAMGGKSKNKSEQKWHDDLADICGCICCVLDGRPRNYEEEPYVSIHHCDGRTKAHAHLYVLPLCAGHHQEGRGAPGMLAIHGHKARFVAEYGTQIELLGMCTQMVLAAGRKVPDGVTRLLTEYGTSLQEGDHDNRTAA